MIPKVKIKLMSIQWALLSRLVKETTTLAPVEAYNLETYVIADLYIKKMAFFTVYPRSTKGVKLSLTMMQAIALNKYLGDSSSAYNAMLRMEIEPKIIENITPLKKAQATWV